MKKLIIFLICVAVIAGVGAGVFFHMQKKDSSVENVLSQGAVVYVRLNDVEKNIEELASMPLFQAISRIDYDLLMEKGKVPAQQRMLVNLVRQQFSQMLSHPMPKKLFGREVALAIYPLERDINALVREIKMFNPQMIEELFSGLALVTRMDPDVQFAEFISRFFSQYGANVTQGQVEYRGETIRTVTLSNVGIKFAFVRLKDLMVIGIGETAARMSVDVFTNNARSLAQDPQFSKVQSKFLDQSSMVGFFDFEAFLAILKRQKELVMGSGGKGQNARMEYQWEDFLAKMAGFKTVAFSSQLIPFATFNNYLLYNPKELSASYAPMYTCPSGANNTVDFVPKDILGYQWGNCFDLKYYWEEVKKEMGRLGEVGDKINTLETKIGFSIERDILPAFGDEIGGYLADIEVGGFFPIPKLTVFIQIENQAKAENLLRRLKEQPMVMLQDEDYNGISIKYLALPMGEGLQPGYCFLKDYLLVSTSRQLLKSSIDASKDKSLSLRANPDFKEVNFGLTDPNRSVQFVKIAEVVEKVKSVIAWSNKWAGAQSRKEEAFKAGMEKPLEEIKASILLKEGELEKIYEDIALLEDEVWNLESKGEDVNAAEERLAELKEQVDIKTAELVSENERKEELAIIIQDNKKTVPDADVRQMYLDEIVYPFLEALRSIKSYGLRVISEKDALGGSLYLKTN